MLAFENSMPLELRKCDITELRVEAIVNAANSSLLGGGGVDGAIHRAAGPELLQECITLNGCKTGQAKITRGYNLYARFVIHTVGPIYQDGKHNEEELLRSCYINSLNLAKEHNIKSIAFPIISSGAYDYPKKEATRIAIDTIKEFLTNNDMEIILCFYGADVSEYFEPLSFDIDKYINDNFVVRENMMRFDTFMMVDSNLPSGRERIQKASMSKPKVCTSLEKKLVCEETIVNELIIDESWQQMLFRLIDEKGMKDSECYKRANIDRKLFSKIRCDEFYQPSKPTAFAFLFGLKLTIDESIDMLEKAGYAFSPSILFDVIVKGCIENKVYDIFRVNAELFNRDLPILGSK